MSTEVFVLAVFAIGFPLFYGVTGSARFPARSYFVLSYFFLLLSNVCTVVEQYAWGEFLNFCEHASFAVSGVLVLIAVYRLTRPRGPDTAATEESV